MYHLTYNENTRELVSNCMFMLLKIDRIKHLLDRKTILLLMEVAYLFLVSYFISQLYGTIHLKKMQRVIKSLKWLNVKDRLFLNDAVMVHKIMPSWDSTFIIKPIHSSFCKTATRYCND